MRITNIEILRQCLNDIAFYNRPTIGIQFYQITKTKTFKALTIDKKQIRKQYYELLDSGENPDDKLSAIFNKYWIKHIRKGYDIGWLIIPLHIYC